MKSNNQHHMYDVCKAHMHAYVLVETMEGQEVDGIVTGIDEENVYLAVPNTEMTSQNSDMSRETRQFGGGYGYPGQGYGSSYGQGYGQGYNPWYGYGSGNQSGYYPGHGRRPFRRLILPLAALTALSVLPWY